MTTTHTDRRSEFFAARRAAIAQMERDLDRVDENLRRSDEIMDEIETAREPEIPPRDNDFSRYTTPESAQAAAAPGEAVCQGQDAAWYRLGVALAHWGAMTTTQRRAYSNARELGLILPNTVNARTLGA